MVATLPRQLIVAQRGTRCMPFLLLLSLYSVPVDDVMRLTIANLHIIIIGHIECYRIFLQYLLQWPVIKSTVL